MIPKDLIIRAVSLILLGFGLFQIIASLIAAIFLVLTGHWSNHVSPNCGHCFLANLAHNVSGLEKILWREFLALKFEVFLFAGVTLCHQLKNKLS
jgi:hypothetical protein